MKVWIQKENDRVNEQVDERIYAMVVGECIARWMSEEWKKCELMNDVNECT